MERLLGNQRQANYKKALTSSLVYLLLEGDVLCGYTRCRDDNGFDVYVYDPLVDRQHRGREDGRLLMEQVCRAFSNAKIYVMGDIYSYYEDKLGYEVEGKIYAVKLKEQDQSCSN